MGEGDKPSDAAVAHAVLSDLPASLWPATLRAVRRVLGERSRTELPPVVRPFARWKPDRLAGDRPRAALAQALAEDAGLRVALVEVLGDEAERHDVDGLAEQLGEDRAAAHLIGAGRWEELATLAARVGEREAAAQDSAAEAAVAQQRQQQRAELERLREEVAALRRERSELREEVAGLRQRAQVAESEREALRGERDAVLAERDELRSQLREGHARHRDREQRLRRRAEQAEALAAVDADRVAAAATELETLAAALRAAVGSASSEAAAPERGEGPVDALAEPGSKAPPEARTASTAAAGPPRGPRAARPGRPCALPQGVRRDSAEGVRALLQVEGLTLLLDGYNVTKHPRGRPAVALQAQRDWLVQQAAALASRFPVRPVLVFDGTEPHPGPRPASRSVRVVFTEGDELADERIVALVDGLADDEPGCVVTGDREVAEACRARHVDVVSSSAFLAALA